MKRIFLLPAMVFAVALTFLVSGCYDDSEIFQRLEGIDDRVTELEKQVTDINSDLDALNQLVAALQSGVTIDEVVQNEDSYTIHFSDGTSITISDGADGVNAPVISVRQDETDGLWYWTLDGEWLLVDGQKVRAQGVDGSNGADSIAPQVRINPDTKMWEISTDGGLTWNSTGVVAEGQTGSAQGGVITQVDYQTHEGYVVFTLADGSTISVPKTAELQFNIEGADAATTLLFTYGETKTYTVAHSGVVDFAVAKPDGWKVALSLDASTLQVTAPTAENTYAETEGRITFTLSAVNGDVRMVSLQVQASADVPAYDLKVLTFEGAYWDALVDSEQYNGPLLYGSTPYTWTDADNTLLEHYFPDNYGNGKFWGGGHAISNYVDMDLANGDYLHQLAVYYQDATTGKGGHNGSSNFCVHFGYLDNSGYSGPNLPSIYFSDGVARVVDHLYVMNSTYFLNSAINGASGFAPALTADEYIKVVATGYDENGDKIATTLEFELAKGSTYVQEWTKWDLSSLGKVMMIEFNMVGNGSSSTMFMHPAYFCYDDVAVRFYR